MSRRCIPFSNIAGKYIVSPGGNAARRDLTSSMCLAYSQNPLMTSVTAGPMLAHSLLDTKSPFTESTFDGFDFKLCKQINYLKCPSLLNI